MGVPGLWEVLKPSGKVRSLTHLAVTEGFEKNPQGVRGYRIGIDASIWSVHMEYGKEGENPHLRTLFFRCANLMKSPFLPLFVFDGPKRPDFKRGKKINKAPHKLIPSMKQIIEAFGFEHRTAPGEAEAELAYLNQLGVIDGVLSDDVDNFLFGAVTVIRNPSNNLSGNKSNPALNSLGKDDKNHTLVFKFSDFNNDPEIGLTRGGLVLIGLLSGGDYHTGLDRCGMKTAVALAKCGFGDSLYSAATTLPRDRLSAFLDSWRTEMGHEIRTNSRGLIGRKSPALAKCLTSDFPDIDVMMSYVNPVTSASLGKPYCPGDIKWNREPDISKIAGICEFFFEWGYKESIIKRFRTVIWHSAVLRILRRGALDIEAGKRMVPTLGAQPFHTPSKSGRRAGPTFSGTPSKMIAKHFSGLGITEYGGDHDDEEENPLIVKIHSTRKHPFTDHILEYRLEISPAQLVRLAELGVQGTRQKPTQEWEDEDEDADKEAQEEAAKDPLDHMRVWMPACMVDIVEPTLVEAFNEAEAKKAAKKANKGQGRSRKKKAAADTDEDEPDASPPKPRKAPARSRKAPLNASENEDDVLPVAPPKSKTSGVRPPAATSKGKAVSSSTSNPTKPKGKVVGKMMLTAPGLSSDEDDSDEAPPSPSRLFAPRPRHPSSNTTQHGRSDALIGAFNSPSGIASSPSPTRRSGVRDLTKKTKSSSSASVSRPDDPTISGFFPASKPSARNLSTTKEKAQQKAAPPVTSATATKGTTKPATAQTNAVAGPSKQPPKASFPLKFFDDVPSEEEGNESFKSDDLFASRTPSPHKRGTLKSTKQVDLCDDSFEFPALFPTRVAAPKTKAAPSVSSKSRSHRERTLSISDSESDSRNRYKKSPRKSASHYSPASSKAPTRAPSPTPQPRSSASSVPAPIKPRKPPSKPGINLGILKNKVDVNSLPVYEISSDEEEDSGVHARVTNPKSGVLSGRTSGRNGTSGRSRVGPGVSLPSRATEEPLRKGPPVGDRIFIDLT